METRTLTSMRTNTQPLSALFRESKVARCTGMLWLYALVVLIVSMVEGRGATLWKENFESASADVNWAPTRGNWQIGTPTNTKGPAQAHSGSRCAAVGLRTNYLNNVSSSLAYFRQLQIPDKLRKPTLRFWHWFSIDLTDPCFQGSADYGQVKVRLANGTEEAISPQYNGASDWSPAALDLTKYAGQTVQIGFYFFSNCATAAAGWFVDDVELVADQYPFMGFESFECGWETWSATRGNWQVGSPQNGPGKAWSGANCAGIVIKGSYPNNGSSSLSSPPIMVPSASQRPRLRFMHWFSIDLTDPCFQGSADYGQVKVRLANGTEEAISPQYNGASDWSPAALDLAKYAGQTVQIEFYFFSNCEIGRASCRERV